MESHFREMMSKIPLIWLLYGLLTLSFTYDRFKVLSFINAKNYRRFHINLQYDKFGSF